MIHSPELGSPPVLTSINSNQKSPRSQAPFNQTTNGRGFLNSQQSVDSDNTINAFFTKDRDGHLVKTQKMLERQQDRVEKVKRAREKALQNELEKSAKLILKERRYESNTKRHEKMISEEAEWRREHYIELTEKREDKMRFTKEHNDKLDILGYKRYLRDDKEVNAKYRQVKEVELQRAQETYSKLHASMEITDKKQRDALELFNTQVEESKKNLMIIEKDRKMKDE